MNLYNKWRPSKMTELFGQDHVVTSIKDSYKSGRLPHALLFVGSRGLGKTTLARIIAALVNCQDPQDGEPCGKCASCCNIELGGQDVYEMDAASNRSVEDIEKLTTDVTYSPMFLKNKVYILDECHQLSSQAKDALLKTLEYPPNHVYFILCTTEGHKVPPTIRSRCQLYEFLPASNDNIIKLLDKVVKGEGATAEPEALETVTVFSGGSFRDALTLLETLLGTSNSITTDLVSQLLGIPSQNQIKDIVRVLLSGDTVKAAKLLGDSIRVSVSLDRFLDMIVNTLLDAIYISASKGVATVAGIPIRELIRVTVDMAKRKRDLNYTLTEMGLAIIILEATQQLGEINENKSHT